MMVQRIVSGSLVLCGCVVLALFAGCSKKQSKVVEDKEFASTPQVKSAQTADSAATDIFDEFYKEEGAAAKTPAAKTTAEPVKKAAAKAAAVPAASGDYAFSENGRYTVQISCVVAAALADKLVSKLKQSNYPAYSAEVQSPTPALSGTYYRVRIGGFNGLSQAKAFAEEVLIPAGYEYWIDSKSNDNVGAEGYGLGSSAGSAASSYTPSTDTPASTETPPSSYESEPSSAVTPAPEPAPAAAAEPEPAPAPTATPASEPAPAPSPTTGGETPSSTTSGSSGWGSSDSSAW